MSDTTETHEIQQELKESKSKKVKESKPKESGAKNPTPSGILLDLDANRAARIEAAGDPFPFLFKGERFTIPPAKAWPITVGDDLSAGHLQKALKSLLGKKDYKRFMACGPSYSDLEVLFEGIAKWQGAASPGE